MLRVVVRGSAKEPAPLTGAATLTMTPIELFEITQAATALPGAWSVSGQCTDDGTCYAGLIDPEGDGRTALLIARDADGLYVAKASGETVARGCSSITEALAAVRWVLRQR
jgi:hypothetical protein